MTTDANKVGHIEDYFKTLRDRISGIFINFFFSVLTYFICKSAIYILSAKHWAISAIGIVVLVFVMDVVGVLKSVASDKFDNGSSYKKVRIELDNALGDAVLQAAKMNQIQKAYDELSASTSERFRLIVNKVIMADKDSAVRHIKEIGWVANNPVTPATPVNKASPEHAAGFDGLYAQMVRMDIDHDLSII